ncbi:MOSC domain-containing protein [Corynebacterium striatum]|uniref:MOSC domain-containing protein n=1 Tax=Corynebacterium striatum TaxID=43770 RepID=UPI003B59A85D
MKVLSTNVAVRRDDPSNRHAYTGIDKKPRPHIELAVPGPNYGDGSGVVGDSIGDHQHHGGAEKAVYAFAREELDYWQDQLSAALPSGSFGENLTTLGIDWEQTLINQRIRVGGALLEVSIARQPCATFAGWMNTRGWLRSFTQRGDCGAYLRIIEPGRITSGDEITLIGRPDHDITMGMAFAAKMGDKELARRVVDAGCLAAVHHDQLVKRLQPRG